MPANSTPTPPTNLTDAVVCVYFNPYEVAYGAVGRVELLIPYSRTDLLVDIVDADLRISELIAN